MLKNKFAVVLGASRGIGEATAKLLAKKGAFVCLISRTEEDLKERVREINDVGGKAEYLVADISKVEELERAFKKLSELGRRVDILVNNSGIYRENSSTHKDNKINLGVVTEIINTNMLGYWLSVIFAKDLIREGGSIINVSSVNGIIGKGNSDIYDMTKAAINNLTINQARQLAPKKIRVNSICPSSTITPMRDEAMDRYLNSMTRQEFDNYEARNIPFKRLASPEEIAEAILFLASDSSRYITGQIISVDGGFLLQPFFLR